MTPEEINAEIAKFCGILIPEVQRPDSLWPDAEIAKAANKALMPNYFADLNAIHAVTSKLIFSKRRQFRHELRRLISEGLSGNSLISFEDCIDATASDRAIALHNMILKWRDQ